MIAMTPTKTPAEMTDDEMIADIARMKCEHIPGRQQRRKAERAIIKQIKKAMHQ